ncbi:MAG: ABC transporter permease [Chromatiales bacterium]|jgi:lipooligosaccharide transport system permease protein|nr:ABC transporter permease [Chromatiales bacterium]MDX9767160.1 ABC transporter permease [Ectothiorhodospiraceae bacterium]
MTTRTATLLPRPSLRFLPVWRRNLRVWRKILIPSVLGNFGEPLLYLLAFGYGFGRLVGQVGELPYMVFLASGIVCSSAMFTASFEALYSAYTRMEEQKTWHAMLGAPLDIDDVVLGEVAWAATKAMMSAVAILLIATGLGLVADWRALLVLPVVGLAAFSFAACAMIVTALSRSYDFFMYYFTLGITPMLLMSGVFFPLDQLPPLVSLLAHLLPLAHTVEIVRPLMTGGEVTGLALHLGVILAYGVVGYAVASALLRRRLLR